MIETGACGSVEVVVGAGTVVVDALVDTTVVEVDVVGVRGTVVDVVVVLVDVVVVTTGDTLNTVTDAALVLGKSNVLARLTCTVYVPIGSTPIDCTNQPDALDSQEATTDPVPFVTFHEYVLHGEASAEAVSKQRMTPDG